MAVKLFILGRPGSGKSAVRRYITKMAQHEFWSPYSIGDYKILHSMCAADSLHTQIRPADFGGFEVLNFSILDTALQIIERKVEKALEKQELDWPRIAIMEFARGDYIQAFSQFDPAFLKDAHFLILDSDVDICEKRIEERTKHREFVDDTFVPHNIMEGYYQADVTQETMCQLREAFGLDAKSVQLIRTDGPRDEFLHDCIREYARELISSATKPRRITGPLTSSVANVVYTGMCDIYCPPPLQEPPQGRGEVVPASEPVEDALERELVGSVS